MNRSLLAAIESAIASATGSHPGSLSVETAAGGCISRAFRLRGEEDFFVKVNSVANRALFDAESDALRAMATAGAVRVPRPVVAGRHGDESFLVLEHIKFRAGTRAEFAELGRQLAKLHGHVSPDGRFGWPHDNFIGATPQPNGWATDWASFWRERRLGFQLELAARNGARFQGAKWLLDGPDNLLRDHHPLPSLLHGDLWGGNAAFDDNGGPVVFDPACYFGDRECDLAFTEMFGGFPAVFYEAYDAAYPRDPGWRTRRDLYNLYHVLNHFNLFGGGYRMQAQAMIDRLGVFAR